MDDSAQEQLAQQVAEHVGRLLGTPALRQLVDLAAGARDETRGQAATEPAAQPVPEEAAG